MAHWQKVHIILLLFVFIPLPIVMAQINPVYSIMKSRGWTPALGESKVKPTPEQVMKSSIQAMGYSNSTIAELKRIGVNLMTMIKWNDKRWAALSDCIIIGKVTRKEYPSDFRPWYHTLAYIKVEKFIRNDFNLPMKQIKVLIVSGPTGEGNIIATRVGEDTLKTGEHVLLFLNAEGLIEFASLNHLWKLYNRLINDSTIYFRIGKKYDIHSNELVCRNEKRNLKDVESDIDSVLAIISKDSKKK